MYLFCKGNSLARNLNFSELKEEITFFISLLFLHLYNRNSLAGLEHFFKIVIFVYLFNFSYCFYSMQGKLISWTYTFFRYTYLTETYQLDFYIFLNIFFYFFFISLLLLQYVGETYCLDLVHFFDNKKKHFSHFPMRM